MDKVLATLPEQVIIFAAEPAKHQPRMTALSLGDIYIYIYIYDMYV
jgi:hypothetical protein